MAAYGARVQSIWDQFWALSRRVWPLYVVVLLVEDRAQGWANDQIDKFAPAAVGDVVSTPLLLVALTVAVLLVLAYWETRGRNASPDEESPSARERDSVIAERDKLRDEIVKQNEPSQDFNPETDLHCSVAQIDLGGLFERFAPYFEVTIDIANYSYVRADLTDVHAKMRLAGSSCNLPPSLTDYHRRLPGDGPVRDKYGGAIWHPVIRQPLAPDHAAWVIHQLELEPAEVELLMDVTLVGIAASKPWSRSPLNPERIALRGPLSAKDDRRFTRGNVFFNRASRSEASGRTRLE